VRTIDQTQECVRVACEQCGAHQTLDHPDHATLVKRGRQIECDVCGTWAAPPALSTDAAA
jgi:ribosomal protein S27E